MPNVNSTSSIQNYMHNSVTFQFIYEQSNYVGLLVRVIRKFSRDSQDLRVASIH